MSNGWDYYKKLYLDEAIKKAELQIEIADLAESPIEKIVGLYLTYLYDSFPNSDLRVHPQMGIGDYFVDFAVECEVSKNQTVWIIVECDGHDFHEKTKEQVARDKERDRFMTKLGYNVLRYSGHEIVKNPYQIVLDVMDIIYSVKG